MPDRGYIRLYRSIWDHQVFREEPFTEQQAWIWLCSHAAWKARQQRLGEHLVNLERGQIIGAVRFLGEKWGWSKGKVERYLERLKNEAMVETETGTGITVITICNYDEYQGGEDDAGTEPGQEPGQRRDAAGTAPGQRRDNDKELNTLKEGKEGESSKAAQPDMLGDGKQPAAPKPSGKRQSKPGVTPEILERFEQFWERCPVKNAKDRAFRYYLEIINTGKATFDHLNERMDAFRVAEEAKFTSGRYSEPWQYTTQPTAWLRDGHYNNKTTAIAASAQRPPQPQGPPNRASTAVQGLLGDLTEADFRPPGGRNG